MSSRNGFAWMKDARVWLNLVQDGSCSQLQTWTNSCFSLLNPVVEVALKGQMASTGLYKTELINILRLHASKLVSSCCCKCLCGLCLDLLLSIFIGLGRLELQIISSNEHNGKNRIAKSYYYFFPHLALKGWPLKCYHEIPGWCDFWVKLNVSNLEIIRKKSNH